MFLRLLILLTLTPLVELWLLSQISQSFGFLTTLAMVIVPGVLGAALAKHQGLHTWIEIRRQMGEGRVPAAMLLDGLLIFIAGVLLITPGVITDVIGFLLLIPPFRRFTRRWMVTELTRKTVVHVQSFGREFRSQTTPMNSSADAIDVEFERKDIPPAA